MKVLNTLVPGTTVTQSGMETSVGTTETFTVTLASTDKIFIALGETTGGTYASNIPCAYMLCSAALASLTMNPQ